MASAGKQLVSLLALGTLAGAGYVAAKDGIFGTSGQKLAQTLAGDVGAAFGRHPAAAGPSGAPPAQGPGPGGDPGKGTTQTQTPHGQTGAPADGTSQGSTNTVTGTANNVPTTLTDLGGVPVVYQPVIGRMMQDPTLQWPNVYSAGDVFIDTRDGQQWQWNGGTAFTSMSSGAGAQLVDFAQS